MNVTYTGKFYKGLTSEMQSPSHSTKITYEVGQTYSVEDFDTDPEECAAGLHIVTSLGAALKWGPLVVEVTVPESAQVVWGNDKVRVSEMTVVRVVSLIGSYLASANLEGSYLASANLEGSYLASANLASANLEGANLESANLSRANLIGANLESANLESANLSRANLSGANLIGANLSGANLIGANLIGANGIPASGMPKGWKLSDNGYWEKA